MKKQTTSPQSSTKKTVSEDHARIIRVFVSSPGDVQAERDVMEQVVASINLTEGEHRQFRLELFRWETAVPSQVGPIPQTVVDIHTPVYDIYLGIMSTHFGTPNGKWGSGTEKEFNDALKSWKKVGKPWITFFFHDKPELGDDPKRAEQYVSVCTFKQSLKKQGIVASYRGVRGSPEGFFEKVSDHLRLILHKLPDTSRAAISNGSKPPNRPKKPAQKASIPAAYLQWLKDQCVRIEPAGLKLQEGQSIKLNSVYVPLTTPVADKERTDPKFAMSWSEEERPVQTLLGLLDRNSLYVAGAPGSGKTTFCSRVAWLACEGHMPPTKIPDPDKYQEQFPASFKGRLPLLVRLRDFWPSLLLSTHVSHDLSKAEFENAFAAWVKAKRPGDLTWPIVKSHLDHGSLLLILDGVDEAPLSHRHAEKPYHPRAMLLSGLAQSLGPWNRLGNRVLLTSRPYGLNDGEVRNLGIPSAVVADLDEPMRELLVRRWFHCLYDRSDEAEAIVKQMLGNIALRQDIQDLTANPMLLTAICIIYHQGKHLPDGRYDLYDRIVSNVLFNRIPNIPSNVDKVRLQLAVVAHGMHTGDGLGERRKTPLTQATFDEIDKLIQNQHESSKWKESGSASAVDAREQLLNDTGLLLPRDDNRAAFYHFTLQDFLCAQLLLDDHEHELDKVFRDRGASPEWRSTLSFLFGALLAKRVRRDRAVQLVEKLIDDLTEKDVALAVVVGECLQILLKLDEHPAEARLKKFQRFCISAIERQVPVRERHELGLALGHIGDPRIVTDLRDRAGYVKVPAGTYPTGGDSEAYDSLDAEQFMVPKPFLLSKYPVTNAQYSLFIAERGYAERKWWSKAGWNWRETNQMDEPELWKSAKWNAPNKPVVGASYWEAEAFAKWAGGRLPSEREWEAAARGKRGLFYPWGHDWKNGICNNASAQLGETSAVGIFPESRSKDFGLEDMAGNVWEWCVDEVGAASRVIRGGSWWCVAGYCRTAFRYWNAPVSRFDFLGFRVAAVPSFQQVKKR